MSSTLEPIRDQIAVLRGAMNLIAASLDAIERHMQPLQHSADKHGESSVKPALSTLAERLRYERERLGLTQFQMAAACGAHRQTQVNYERGGPAPKGAYLARAAAVGVDIEYLMHREPS